MIPRPGQAAALLATGCLAALAGAQSATVQVWHDHPTGLVLPGEQIHLTVQILWSNAVQLGAIAGDALASPDVGDAINLTQGSVGLGPLVSLGAPAQGSIRGVDLSTSLLFQVTPWAGSPFTVLRYDWVAPSTPGQVEFNWTPRPDLPSVMVYPTPASSLVPAATTYLGTSLTVIPAPAGLAALALAGALAPRRRRTQ